MWGLECKETHEQEIQKIREHTGGWNTNWLKLKGFMKAAVERKASFVAFSSDLDVTNPSRLLTEASAVRVHLK